MRGKRSERIPSISAGMRELCGEEDPFIAAGQIGHHPYQETVQQPQLWWVHEWTIADRRLYGDNVFEKDGIRRDRTGDGEKTRCLCGKRGIFNRDGPAMGPQIIRQLE